MLDIHPQAIVDPKASIADDVVIGAFSQVGPNVILDEGVHLHSHAVVDGFTHIGANTTVYPFAVIGMPPQDLKYQGEPSRIEIGKRCQIREAVTIHPGTKDGGLETVIGDDCLLMVSAHVAHDCHLGNHVIMANNATLAGHVTIGDHAILGGLCAVLQFVRIGKHAMVSGMAGVANDVPPFAQVFGCRAEIENINLIGMRRHGFSRDEIKEINVLYQELFYQKNDLCLQDRIEKIDRAIESEHSQDLLTFLRADSKKCICHVCEKKQ